MKITLNGREKEFLGKISIEKLCAELPLKTQHFIVELNHEIMEKSAWGQTLLKDGDRIEVICFVGGG